jgi:phage-related protein (TIGR01555 family)
MGYSQRFTDAKPEVFPQAKRSHYFSSVRQKFWKDSSEITISHLEESYNRNGLAHQVIDLRADKAFNRGWEPDVEDDKLNSELKALENDKKIRYWLRLKEAFKWSSVFGYAIVLISYVDGGENLSDPVKNPVGITQLSVVDKRHVKKFIYQDETNCSGDIIAVELLGKMVGLSEDIVIHASRFEIVGDPQGRGVLFPAWNWLELFDNNTWSFGQAMFRYGSGFPFLTIKDASDTELEEAEALWANVTARTGLVGDDRHQLEFVGAAGKALDFSGANEVGLKLVSIAMGMPYALVVGAHAGTISGSETNSSELYDKIESIQRNEIEPLVFDFITRFYEVGLISRIDFGIKWIPLWQLDSKELATIEYTNAQSDQIYLQLGILSPNEVRRKRDMKRVEPDPDFDIEGGEEFKKAAPVSTPFAGGSVSSTPGEVLPPNQNSPGQDAVILQQANMSKLEDNAEFEKIIESATKQLADLYDWSAIKKAINQLNTVAGDDNQTELLTKIELIIDSNLADARTVIDKVIEETYGAGYSNAEQEVEQSIPVSSAAKSGKSALKAGLFEIVKGLNNDVKRELRNVLLDELQKAGGSDLNQVRTALKESLSSMQQDIPDFRIKMIARTESNRAFNEANFRVYQDAGIAKIQVITARDDRVRPDHARVDGETRPIGTPFSNGYLRPPFGVNCRCSIIPVIGGAQ